MFADTLSDILQAVRLKSAVFFEVDTSAPWAAEAPPAQVIAPAVMPGAGHVIEYHVLTRGACWASVVGHDVAPVRMTAGDVVAFPQGDAHVMSSAPGLRGELDFRQFQRPEDSAQMPLLVRLDGGGDERAHLVCGFLGWDARPFNPLLDSLPRILHMPASEGDLAQQFARLAVTEGKEQRAGAHTMMSRLGELMFVELVRRYVETLPPDSGGWLAGLRDRHVGRALTLLHGDPRRDWTLELLARQTGLSRSSLAARFSRFAGMPPMQYLQNWRLQLAARQLADGRESIATIAAHAGYESEAAFSRAFRRMAGKPPAAWRNATVGRAPVRPPR